MTKSITNHFCFRNGNIDAYLGDYPILDYARVKLDPNCNLYIVPQSFGEDEYGIGFPKDSPLQVSRQRYKQCRSKLYINRGEASNW